MYPRQPNIKKVLLLTPVARAVMQAVIVGIPPAHVQQEKTMKVSLGKFYGEVTGKSTGGRDTIVSALIRWGIPYDDEASKRKMDCVDVSHVDAAKKLYQAEQESKAERRPTVKVNGSITPEQFQELRDGVKACSAAVMQIAGLGESIFEIKSDIARILARQDDIINRLSKLRR